MMTLELLLSVTAIAPPLSSLELGNIQTKEGPSFFRMRKFDYQVQYLLEVCLIDR